VQETGQSIALSKGADLVQVEHLCQTISTHAQKTILLDDITLTIPAGSLFAMNGPSGSRKSTPLNRITGIDRPTSGRLIFAIEELRTGNEDALARWRGRHVGIVFQFFQLVPITEHRTGHARHTHVVSTMMQKMISPALFSRCPCQLYLACQKPFAHATSHHSISVVVNAHCTRNNHYVKGEDNVIPD
jgi:ABC-type molybdenum transport system ATPase subunit/photorepair protein PhrA